MKRLSNMLILLISLFILLLSCKGKKQENSLSPRPFPSAGIPQLLSDDEERLEWMTMHIWDRFLDTTGFYGSDSLRLNGVAKDEVEKQMGTFVTLLENIPAEKARSAVGRAFSLAEAFSTAHPDSGLLEDFAELFRKYVYDPASPVRDEELWLAFVEPLLASPLAKEEMRGSREWEKKVCSMNRPGTKAPDFAFTELSGRWNSLYGVKADYTVLIFGNPDCNACRGLVEAFRGSPQIGALISDGALKVVDIYIDEDVEAWKAAGEGYPKEWINGYDHLRRINSDRIYAVRGIPSVYLLDKDKTILLKDAPEDRLLAFLAGLQ